VGAVVGPLEGGEVGAVVGWEDGDVVGVDVGFDPWFTCPEVVGDNVGFTAGAVGAVVLLAILGAADGVIRGSAVGATGGAVAPGIVGAAEDEMVGASDTAMEGAPDGASVVEIFVGAAENPVARADGAADGTAEPPLLGDVEGFDDGTALTCAVGNNEKFRLNSLDGDAEGKAEGDKDKEVGTNVALTTVGALLTEGETDGVTDCATADGPNVLLPKDGESEGAVPDAMIVGIAEGTSDTATWSNVGCPVWPNTTEGESEGATVGPPGTDANDDGTMEGVSEAVGARAIVGTAVAPGGNEGEEEGMFVGAPSTAKLGALDIPGAVVGVSITAWARHSGWSASTWHVNVQLPDPCWKQPDPTSSLTRRSVSPQTSEVVSDTKLLLVVKVESSLTKAIACRAPFTIHDCCILIVLPLLANTPDCS
jgi:hypothetical protein